MIARALRPDDVILWPGDGQWWWVHTSRPVDPGNAVLGPWRLGVEQLTGLEWHQPQVLRAEDVSPEGEFPLWGWDW